MTPRVASLGTPGGRTVFSLIVLLLVGACTSPVQSHGCEGPAGDHVMLVDRLRCAGIRVDIGERVTVPILRPPGTKLLLSGGGLAAQAELSSFDYGDTDLGADGRAVSEADTRKFAPDGSLVDRGQSIYYRGTPHLFHRERVIVIYAGDDRAVVAVLTRLLGNQFAGR